MEEPREYHGCPPLRLVGYVPLRYAVWVQVGLLAMRITPCFACGMVAYALHPYLGGVLNRLPGLGNQIPLGPVGPD